MDTKNKFVLLSDDYGKIKFLDFDNIQKIRLVSTIRKAFLVKILNVGEETLSFFNDNKMYIGSLNLENDFNDDFQGELVDVS